MLGIDPKPARAVWTAFLVVLALATVYAVRESIVVFMIALFFSYMLAPVVNFLSDRLPKRIAHSLALAIVYLSLLGVLIAIGATLGTRLADEAGMLAKRLPEVMQKPDWMHAIPLPAWLEPMRDRVIASVQDEFRTGGKDLMPYSQPRYATCLDLGSENALFTTGWERIVKMSGPDAKALKKQIVTQIAELKMFYPAEDYHQDFVKLNPRHGYVVVNALPKIEKTRKEFPNLVHK